MLPDCTLHVVWSFSKFSELLLPHYIRQSTVSSKQISFRIILRHQFPLRTVPYSRYLELATLSIKLILISVERMKYCLNRPIKPRYCCSFIINTNFNEFKKEYSLHLWKKNKKILYVFFYSLKLKKNTTQKWSLDVFLLKL